jgi:D-glycerate 3-kinase
MNPDTSRLDWPDGLLAAKELEQQWRQLCPSFDALMRHHRLPESMAMSYGSVIFHLAAWVMREKTGIKTYLLGINGAQGSGKSTLAAFLAQALKEIHHQRVAVLSIDDLYKTRAERQQLGRDIHPLLVTRGVPGTHDVSMGLDLIRSLKVADDSTITPLPVFSKAMDDRTEPSAWRRFQGRPDVILFEGWCVGSTHQTEQDLTTPINRLERDEDRDGRWRRYANAQLEGHYKALFAELDGLLMLKVPDMSRVVEWRTQQESQLAAQSTSTDRRLMDSAALERFIMHYERITRHSLTQLPQRADMVLSLNDEHDFCSVQLKSPQARHGEAVVLLPL